MAVTLNHTIVWSKDSAKSATILAEMQTLLREDYGTSWLDWSLAALFVDLDGDGDEDLAVSTTMGLLLLENDGDAYFRRRRVVGKLEARAVHVSGRNALGEQRVTAACELLGIGESVSVRVRDSRVRAVNIHLVVVVQTVAVAVVTGRRR